MRASCVWGTDSDTLHKNHVWSVRNAFRLLLISQLIFDLRLNVTGTRIEMISVVSVTISLDPYFNQHGINNNRPCNFPYYNDRTGSIRVKCSLQRQNFNSYVPNATLNIGILPKNSNSIIAKSMEQAVRDCKRNVNSRLDLQVRRELQWQYRLLVTLF